MIISLPQIIQTALWPTVYNIILVCTEQKMFSFVFARLKNVGQHMQVHVQNRQVKYMFKIWNKILDYGGWIF